LRDGIQNKIQLEKKKTNNNLKNDDQVWYKIKWNQMMRDEIKEKKSMKKDIKKKQITIKK
jgi:hypothetical protein